MNKTIHRIYILALACIVSFVTLYIGYKGFSYYRLPVSERYYHPDYDWFKPSGFFGHGLGIVGTILIIIGVGLYILSKKYGFLTRYIRLKYILESPPRSQFSERGAFYLTYNYIMILCG